MDLVVLADELSTDPLARGYAGMTDLEAANDLNTVYRTRELEMLDGGTVYDQVDNTEFTALDAAGQAEVWDIVHLGANIPVGVGSKARDRFVALFGGGSDTITALQATLTENISRGVELGLGVIAEGHVTKARFTG